ncbi:MAG: hypothetical protein KJ583_06415 [Nanoarchaeota archaeon]|nr:hypothetical protein [Nanoarchaeota archaeon]MBU1269233.1 hypothetical protein [Nanoarchaeota archaeon]MBU1604919.1 hypothetical protein [Nanoarchaeota archaeon]MBU2443513.1 hypothetical protein [Nanoarchaeota archaeon]
MMGDISTIQKINSTSKELKNFGFADSMQDSFSQARKIYMPEEDKNSSITFSSNGEAMEALSYNFKKYKDMSDSRMKKMSEQITELQEYMKQMLNKQQSRPVVSSQPVHQEVSQAPQQKVVQQQRNTSSESKPYNQRQGSFTPDDVKIENIFYCGNKK